MSNAVALAKTDVDALKAKIERRLLAFAVKSQTKMASAIIRASREYMSNLTAGMALCALGDEGIATDAEFTATSSYFEAGFDVALELAALALAGSADDDEGEAVETVLQESYSRITDIIATYYVDLAAQVDPRQ